MASFQELMMEQPSRRIFDAEQMSMGAVSMEVFGYPAFKDGQKEAIEAITQGIIVYAL